MKKAKNLTVGDATLVGIHKVEKHDPRIYRNSGDWNDVLDVHFVGDRIYNSTDYANPQTNVGLLLGLKAASAVDRPTCSHALYFEDDVYWMASWSEIFGRKGSKAPSCHRDGRLIKFAYKCTNAEHRQMILDLIAKRGLL